MAPTLFKALHNDNMMWIKAQPIQQSHPAVCAAYDSRQQHKVCTHCYRHCSNIQTTATTGDRCEGAAEPAVAIGFDETMLTQQLMCITSGVADAQGPVHTIHVWLAPNHPAATALLPACGRQACDVPSRCLPTRSSPCLRCQTDHGRTRSGVQHCLPRAAGRSAVCIVITCTLKMMQVSRRAHQGINEGIQELASI